MPWGNSGKDDATWVWEKDGGTSQGKKKMCAKRRKCRKGEKPGRPWRFLASLTVDKGISKARGVDSLFIRKELLLSDLIQFCRVMAFAFWGGRQGDEIKTSGPKESLDLWLFGTGRVDSPVFSSVPPIKLNLPAAERGESKKGTRYKLYNEKKQFCMYTVFCM